MWHVAKGDGYLRIWSSTPDGIGDFEDALQLAKDIRNYIGESPTEREVYELGYKRGQEEADARHNAFLEKLNKKMDEWIAKSTQIAQCMGIDLPKETTNG